MILSIQIANISGLRSSAFLQKKLTVLSQENEKTIENPTIGVLTIPLDRPEFYQYTNASSYIFTSNYEMFVNSSITPVFIPYDATDEDLQRLLAQVNGVYFSGGSLILIDPYTGIKHQYTQTAEKVLNFAKERYNNGVHFPILGVCQGFQLLQVLELNHTEFLKKIELENLQTPANLTKMSIDSKLIQAFTPVIQSAIQNENILFHLHHNSVLIEMYEKYPQLGEAYRVLGTTNWIQPAGNYTQYESNDTTNVDIYTEPTQVTIATIIEHQTYPFYGMVVHPEMYYEIAVDVQVSKSDNQYQYLHQLGLFLRSELLKNQHKFESNEELEKWKMSNGIKGVLGIIDYPSSTLGFNYKPKLQQDKE
eukprot:403332871